MNFIHNVVAQPMTTEFTMFSEQSKFVEKVVEKKYLNIDISFNTKKSLDISIYLPGFRFSINHEVGGFKYLIKENYSYFTYKTTKGCYLKISKTQGFETIKKHVELIIEQYLPSLFNGLDELEVRYFQTVALNEVLDKEA